MTMSPYEEIRVQRLSSGYYHVRGRGPCNWAQPPWWPCDEKTLRDHAFPGASEEFIRSAVRLARITGLIK
jgi:hypothetical protein